ncbi:SLAP domain-containing protein [Lactobacillus intestinalis]|uniref:S-layer protein C-terminal domain-containing protein n=1 Tax=Lactobacillus intestinalis DSM 6629 TaxID=1423761 RepID=A0ABR5PSG7_9LACO|nr:SLAP domain-containing protein [Lactobacillus intestinalis]KRM32940.1 hypothetical protein FC44_GL001493 [Lactobacillus intestinalis DSM 6629]UTW40499.1 SLAP domain-containing protein [Lactobacillus intestinalis]
MKPINRFKLSLAVLMVVISVFTLSSKTSAATFIGTLNHNSYLYNQNGVRLKTKGKLYKNHKVKLIGKLTEKTVTMPYTRTQYEGRPVKAPYYFLINNYGESPKRCYLSYKMIKNHPYYSLGKGQYIRAANVGHIDNHTVAATERILTVKRNAHLWSYNLKPLSETVIKGQKVKVDALINLGNYNVTNRVYCFYRIKGTQTYIYANDTKAPRIDLEFAEKAENRK